MLLIHRSLGRATATARLWPLRQALIQHSTEYVDLLEQVNIINMTNATIRFATPGVAPYATFKGSLEVLTRYIAKEFGSRKTRANAISPEAIRIDMTSEAFNPPRI